MKQLIVTIILMTVSMAAYADHHTRSSGYAVGLEIVDAWYGSDRRSCDATYALNHCNGRAHCDVQASNRLCGDPDKGVRKQLAVR